VKQNGHRVILASLELRNRRHERNTTMADERMGLLELLRKAGPDGDTDFLRTGGAGARRRRPDGRAALLANSAR
ncbi:MAG TPA: hypothetical protein VIK32_11950, partial [Candidatus Limnocylindrales bacterium]